jgi:hypothetical protein
MKTLLLSVFLGLACIAPAAAPSLPAIVDSVAKTTKRAEKIIFPRVEFREASLQEIAHFLSKKSKDLDPEKIGVEIQITPEGLAAADKTKITLSLNNVPQIEIVKYVTNLANLRYTLETSKIVLQPLNEK